MDATAVIREIRKQLDSIMVVDAAWCRRRLPAIERRLAKGQAVERELKPVLARFTASGKRVNQRRLALPVPDYDKALPITVHRNEILETIRDHQVVVLAGETGSGKTTQLPKMCLEAGRGTRGLIACTQPRRIAARAMAERVSEELGTALGNAVGYQVRFREQSSPDSYIKFMTDGILLAASMGDRFMDAYDTIIIDEAHERSLNIDFLLGYLKRLLPRRRDLKLMITSATIDTRKFARHFNDAPVIEVSGRSYPVDLVYQPLDTENDRSETGNTDLYRGISDAVSRLTGIDRDGDILVFLSGEREIREASDYLTRQNLKNTEVMPLYGRLSSAEQRRVFHPGRARRIIFSTNVAETSLTVPRIRFVIDSGLARISRYAHRSRIQRLPIEAISQASANQRSGRCGRLGPGTCIRLYSEEDYETRPEYTEPEILRTSLASVILRMLTMGLGAVQEFPFIDPPAPRMIRDAKTLLLELGALDGSGNPSELGRRLVRWPLDVRLARMILEAEKLHCLEDLLVLAAALSIQDPRERPLDAQAAADEAHQRFVDSRSDFTTLLRLWQYLRKQRHSISGNQFRKLCRREFLNWQRVLEWFDLYQQLRDQAREERLHLSGRHGDFEQVHKALLSGFLSQVGRKHPENHGYQGARSTSFHIFPGSGLFGKSPKWVVSAEIVETSRLYARMNAAVQPNWIEQQGSHLLKRHCFDPHWSKRQGAVMAWEQLSLFGLVIAERRKVSYAPVNPVEARQIFIMEALVRGNMETRASFMSHNQQLRREVEELEHKRRKRDVLADEHAQYDFFDARVPGTVNDIKSFESWLEGLGREGRKILYLGYDVLMREDAGTAPAELFPDELSIAGQHYQLDYHFEPGHENDGVTLTVPLELLNTLDEGRLQWLVPGLLRDKITALIKQLPKPVRRSLTPAPAFADALMEALQTRREEPLLEGCAAELSRITGLEVRPADLVEDSLPDHHRFLIRLVDGDGRPLATSRRLAELQEALGKQAQRSFMDQKGADYNRDGQTAWTFGELEPSVETQDGTRAWPALVDQGDAVGMRLFDTWDESVLSHMDGVRRLLGLTLAGKLQYLRRHHGLSSAALRAWGVIDSSENLIKQLCRRSLFETAGDVSSIRKTEDFEALAERVRKKIGETCLELAGLLNRLLPAFGRINAQLTGPLEDKWPEAASDIASQLADMVYPGFLGELGPGRLEHYPRYLEAIEERLRQLEQNPLRDRQRLEQIEPWWNRYVGALEQGRLYDQAMDEFRWLLEEYRVSIFAQRLGTSAKVSQKRLAAAWLKVSGES